jgi:predicted nucleic acid-binding protein
MILYVDTSALVKRYVQESSSEQVTTLIDSAEATGSSILTQVEIAAALAKGVRQARLDDGSARRAWDDYLAHWPSFTRLVVSAGVLERASELTWEHGLRAYDALHFASALIWQDAIAAPITLATFDRELWTAAQRAGIHVWPEQTRL